MRFVITATLSLLAASLLPLQGHAHGDISLQLKWKHAFQFAGFYIAKEKGFYDEEDLNVTLIEGGPGRDPITHTLAETGHYAITDTGIVLSRAHKQKVKALAAIFQHSPLALAVRESSKINTFQQLRGKRVMMQTGHMDAVIFAAIKKSGVNDDDFIRQNTTFNIDDLINNKTDAFSIYITDQPHQLTERDISYRILHPIEFGIDFYGDILITSEREIKEHPERTDAFIRASLKGWSYALEHIDETIELIKQKYNTQNLSTGQLYFEAEETIDMVLKDVVQIGYMSQPRWQTIIDTYVELNLISEGSTSAQDIIYIREPTFSDLFRQHQWQIIVGTLVMLLVIFGLHLLLLRRMVSSKTEELKANEARYRSLVNNIPGAVYRCLPHEQCSMAYISDEVESISGFPSSDFINSSVRSYRSIIHEDDKEYVIPTIHNSVKEGHSYSIEYRIIRVDGKTRWVVESGQPGTDNSGKHSWIDGCIFDISTRKRAESLERSTALILEMIAGNQDLNTTFQCIIDIFEERYPGMMASILLIKSDKLTAGCVSSLPDEYNNAIEGLHIGPSVGSCGTAAFEKRRVIVEDIASDPLWAEYADFTTAFNLRACWSEPIFDSNGDVLGTFAMYYDHIRAPDAEEISDIANAAHLTAIAIERNNFIQSLHKLSQAIEQTAEVITITDQFGKIEYVNPAFTDITGYTFEEAIGNTPHLFRDPSYEHLAKEIRKVILNGDTWQGKVMERKKDGSTYPAMLTISPIRNEKDEITHHVGVHEDLTKLQQMEEQFYQAQKMEAIGTLVGGIAHDFNNMLAGITGNIYLAKKMASHDLKIKEKLNHADNLIGRAADMIKQLLTFAKKDIVQKRTILLTPFLKETFNLHKVTIPEDVELDLDIRDNMKVSADITQLQQVLLNLMTNARDAVEGKKGAAIHIRLERFSPDSDFLNRHETAKDLLYAHLAVQDNGHGIPKESINTIFEPFFTTKAVGKGTGLGLSMVHGSVQSHDGIIDVDSSPGTGSCFNIYLPLISSEVESKPLNSTSLIDATGERILLVDDEPDVLEIIGEVLESLDYNVVKAEDGVQALQIFTEESDSIDILLTDIIMPKMGGIELAGKVRELRPDLPVIFATGYERDKAIEKNTALKRSTTLNKPYSVELLAQTLSSMLNSHVSS